MIRRPPTSPLFPYTTLSRSVSIRALRRLCLEIAQDRERLRTASTARQGVRGPQHDHAWEPRRPDGGRRAKLRERRIVRSEEHTSELQSQSNIVCRLLLDKTN